MPNEDEKKGVVEQQGVVSTPQESAKSTTTIPQQQGGGTYAALARPEWKVEKRGEAPETMPTGMRKPGEPTVSQLPTNLFFTVDRGDGSGTAQQTAEQPAQQDNDSKDSASTDHEQETKAVVTDQEQEQKVVPDTSGSTGGNATANTDESKRREMPERMSWQDMMKVMGYTKPLTDEERAKEAKRKKREQMWASISDMISAAANMFAGTNTFDYSKGQTIATNARWDKLEQERKENQQQWASAFGRVYEADYGDKWQKYLQGYKEDSDKETVAQKKAALALQAQKNAQEADLNKSRIALNVARQTEAEAKGKTAQIIADNQQEKAKAELGLIAARTGAANAGAVASRASAAASKAAAAKSNRGDRAEFTAYDEKGNAHSFHSSAAADAYARQHGTYKTEQQTGNTTSTTRPVVHNGRVRTDGNGRPITMTSTTTQTTTHGYPSKPRQSTQGNSNRAGTDSDWKSRAKKVNSTSSGGKGTGAGNSRKIKF